ncbi:hypothetical protein Aph01nite_73870 [Acrocarpospora phusangensis]|uniref:Uncharacterized protein n=1 Tax=Acrocarpospora phusangensis TaxID=1070424 RepID=A0A919QHJ9_9ACTN|nr:hypothetical protein [Acrocarpospora phusangensis]GIH29077.1 hypothetical protein Aph01nite_73870 [Acrocarpospora phusangensis]
MMTNAGRDMIADSIGKASGRPAVAEYIALSANATAPSAANTTLPGEITTGGGGLIRSAATYAHTGGASTYTLTKTFTANGSDALPVTIAKIGVLNAAASGTLVHETLLNATATLSSSGDQLTVTQTVTLS